MLQGAETGQRFREAEQAMTQAPSLLKNASRLTRDGARVLMLLSCEDEGTLQGPPMKVTHPGEPGLCRQSQGFQLSWAPFPKDPLPPESQATEPCGIMKEHNHWTRTGAKVTAAVILGNGDWEGHSA